MGKTLNTLLAGIFTLATLPLIIGCELTPEGRAFFRGLAYHAAERSVEHEVDNLYNSRLKKSQVRLANFALSCENRIDLNQDGYIDMNEFMGVKDIFNQGQRVYLFFHLSDDSSLGSKVYVRVFNEKGELCSENPSSNTPVTHRDCWFYHSYDNLKPGSYTGEFYSESGKKLLSHEFRIR